MTEGDPRVAPVIPLFADQWDATWANEPVGGAAQQDAVAVDAEAVLLRKLRARQLSVAEAGALLRAEGLTVEASESVVARCLDLGYLDDAALAERLIEVGTSRRGHGRQLVAQTLAQRGIPRSVADAALAALPDDDEAERALEFARSRLRSVRSAAPDAALRRLVGQLSRRGYGSAVALSAARQALREEA